MFSEFSAFSALVFFSFYALICCFLCKKVGWQTLRAFGIGIGLLLVRCLLPFEIPGVELVRLSGWYADVWLWLAPYPAEGITPLDVLLSIWMVGSLFLLGRLFYRLARQFSLIRMNAVNANHRLRVIYQDVLHDMSCNSVGIICVSTEFQMPMMAGFFKPHIFFPQELENLSEEELRFIFQHEITHFQKRDLWIKLFVELLCCALWWNPVVYWLRTCISQLLEMRCDSLVCEYLETHQQLEYSQTLLNSFKKSAHPSVCITAEYLGYPSKERLKQRFTQILYAPSQPKKIGISVIIVALAMCAFISSYCFVIQPSGLPEKTDNIYEQSNVSFENSYILRYPDGSLKVFVDHQLYAEISEEELSKAPFSTMLVIDVNISSEED